MQNANVSEHAVKDNYALMNKQRVRWTKREVTRETILLQKKRKIRLTEQGEEGENIEEKRRSECSS